jgi:hypothetical protein
MVSFKSASQLLKQLMDAMGLKFIAFLWRYFALVLKKRGNLVHFWGQNTQKRVLFSHFLT